jgi:tetratricopeptide (TPR) repeat protein
LRETCEKAVELHPRDAETQLGLAAAYGRLNRFDLADRAYDQAVKIIGCWTRPNARPRRSSRRRHESAVSDRGCTVATRA